LLPLSPSPFESINQLGGSMRGIVMQGDTAFVGMGPRLAAIDLTDPASPQLMGLSPAFPGMVNALIPLPDAPNMLVAAAGKRLVVVDVSDPANIVALHALELPGSILSLALDADNDILYATGETTSQPSRTRSYVVSVRVGPDGCARAAGPGESGQPDHRAGGGAGRAVPRRRPDLGGRLRHASGAARRLRAARRDRLLARGVPRRLPPARHPRPAVCRLVRRPVCV
jgi:hypothetical protein